MSDETPLSELADTVSPWISESIKDLEAELSTKTQQLDEANNILKDLMPLFERIRPLDSLVRYEKAVRYLKEVDSE